MQANRRHTHRVAGKMVANEPWWIRWSLIGFTWFVIGGLILVPVLYVFVQALEPGLQEYWKALTADPDTRHSIFLTLTVAPVVVVLNTIFGVIAAWCITRFKFPGRTLLITILDVPFAVSPVVVGLCFMLLFGRQGYFGPMLRDAGIPVAFAYPGLVLATTFVTLPFVARELIPLMQSLGSDEEVAAVSLGASPWQLFWRVTLPNIKWGLVYGIIQCNSRAIGEYGAVFVVSGHIAGKTDTMPLRVQKLFEESKMSQSFALASLLTLMALVTLLAKILLERYLAAQEAARAAEHGPTE